MVMTRAFIQAAGMMVAPVMTAVSPQVVPRSGREMEEARLRLLRAERTMAFYERGMVGVLPFTPLMRKTLVALLASYGRYSWEEWVIVPHNSVRGQRMALMFDDQEGGWYCQGTAVVYDDRIEMNDGRRVFYLQEDVEGLVEAIRAELLTYGEPY